MGDDAAEILQAAMTKLDELGGWDAASMAKELLTDMSMTKLDAKIRDLSGRADLS